VPTPLFSDDGEFQKLLSRRRDVDLVTAALELARDAEPDLDFRPTQDWIEQRGAEVASKAALCYSENAVFDCLIPHLTEEHSLQGDEAGFDRPEYSYLPHVIATGRGLPISLSVIYMEVGRQAGIMLEGVSAPMHFLSRYQASHGPVFLDAFGGGQTFSQPECVDWLQARTGLPIEQVVASLRSATPRHIVMRMLHNLKQMHSQQGNWRLAMRVQQRLVALNPADGNEQRDLGLFALRADEPGVAYDALSQCLTRSHGDQTDRLRELLLTTERDIAQRN